MLAMSDNIEKTDEFVPIDGGLAHLNTTKEIQQGESANEEIESTNLRSLPCSMGGRQEILVDKELEMKDELIFNLEGLEESGGIIYIACKENGPKTDPKKIREWFPAEFIKRHRVYAIKEEEAYLLKVFTRIHEIKNQGIRKKGGRKVILMGQEVFGDIMLACGYCGYWSHEGSNVRRHLKKAVCIKEKGYSEEDLIGLNKVERRRFLRRVAAAKSRAKKRANGLDTGDPEELSNENINNQASTMIQNEGSTNNRIQDHLTNNLASDNQVECLVEIQETSQKKNMRLEVNVGTKMKTTLHKGIPPTSGPRIKRKLSKPKPLKLGPAVKPEVVQRVAFDIYTVNDQMERIAWKPPTCPKVSNGGDPCKIVFKGVRMKRRCMDLPIPMILTYRKLDCKSHHCIFTLFHKSVRESFICDSLAKSSVSIKMYGDTVMTQEFYYYFSSLMSFMKMKASQVARHFTSIWESIIAERISLTNIPPEYRKIITLSKQTVKKIWSSIQDEVGNSGSILRLGKNPSCARKRCHPQPTSAILASENNTDTTSLPHTAQSQEGCKATQPLQYSGMKHVIYTNNKPPHPVWPSPGIMVCSGPSAAITNLYNNLQPPPPQPPPPHSDTSLSVASVTASPNTSAPSNSNSHWSPSHQQYPHSNMHHHPMGPPSTEYYQIPAHFVPQQVPVTIGSSP